MMLQLDEAQQAIDLNRIELIMLLSNGMYQIILFGGHGVVVSKSIIDEIYLIRNIQQKF